MAEVTEGDVDAAVARAFGRVHVPGANNGRGINEAEYAQRLGLNGPAREGDWFDEAVHDLRQKRAEERESAPWRAECAWSNREALAAAEADLVELYSTRRGQTPAMARQSMESALREAWFKPAGFGTTHDRMVSVERELRENTSRLRALTPIASPGALNEQASTPRARKVHIVSEGQR